MARKVFVTGIGIISSIGNNIEETLLSLKEKRTGIGPIDLLQTKYKATLPAGEIKLSNTQLGNLAGVDDKNGFTRTALLGIIAAGQALNNAGINNPSQNITGLISGTSVGGMDTTENFYPEFYKDNTKGKISQAATHDCGDSTEKIADHFGIKDYVSTISTACSSAANAIMFGARLIQSGRLNVAVAGGTDALARFTVNGFNSLMILDKENCRPFDESRVGLNLGEGAAYLVLESEESVEKSGKTPLCEISGYGNSCDAHHQTATSPDGDGPYLAMKAALESGKLSPEDIDYINAHGTGTGNNDLTEGIAMKRLFGDDIPPFSSTKAYTGHTLGAAGGIEAVISILTINHQIMFPNLNFNTPITGFGVSPLTDLNTSKKINNVLSNSFGFGGNDSALVFSACK